MARRVFYIIDIFAEEKFAGNQLAVYRNAGALSSVEMQKIAKEMHFSETGFILSEKQGDDGYDISIFSPEKEMPFAGHPTLRTAYVMQQEIIKQKVDKVVLNLKVGQILVSLNYKGTHLHMLFMKQIPPTFGQIVYSKTVSEVLGIDVNDIDASFPIEEVSTGVPFLIVPLKTLDAVKRVRTNRDKYFKLIERFDAKAMLIFCRETYSKENDLNVRVFADYFSVEDPAAGTANGCLAGYLVKHRYFGKDSIHLRVEQGYEIEKPSLLLLKAEDKAGRMEVFVGGRAIIVAKGELV